MENHYLEKTKETEMMERIKWKGNSNEKKEEGQVRGVKKQQRCPGSLESHGLPVPKQRQQVKNNA